MADREEHFASGNILSFGVAYDAVLHAANNRKGVPVHIPTWFDRGTPAVADLDLLIDAATSTELPDTETVTYTTADDGSSPFDNTPTPAPASVEMADGATYSVWTLDAPRKLVCTTAHSSSVVAMTVVVHGFDEYGYKMSETFAIGAGGTSDTVNGVKAFKYVYKIAITAAADAEANTLDLGTQDEIGLPYRLVRKDKLVGFFDGAIDVSVNTIAVDTDPATATTGDPRGSMNPAGTLNGSKALAGFMFCNPDTRATLLGITHYYDTSAFS